MHPYYYSHGDSGSVGGLYFLETSHVYSEDDNSHISHSITQRVIKRILTGRCPCLDALKRWDHASGSGYVDRSTFQQRKALQTPVRCQWTAKCKKTKQVWAFLMCVMPKSCAVIGGNTRVCSCFQVAVIWAKPTPLICSVGLSNHIRSVLGELPRRPTWMSK